MMQQLKISINWQANACVCSHTRVCSPSGSSVHGILQAKNAGVGPFPPLGGSSQPRIEYKSPVSPSLTDGFFTIVPPEKPIIGRTRVQTHVSLIPQSPYNLEHV